MFSKVKYIITAEKEIVVFGEVMQHKEFSRLKPIRAGFISFGVNKDGNPSCSCYGKSVSLGLEADEVEDTKIAKRQLNMLDDY